MRKTILTASVILCTAMFAAAQGITHESYAKARPVLDKAIAAYGGLAELRAIENVSLRVEGETVHRNQSRRTFMSERTPYKGEFVIDAKNTRFRQSQDGQYPGGFYWRNGFGINRTEGATWDLIRGTISPIPNVQASAFRQRLRLMPHFIILNAAERASRLRYLGKASHENRPHSVISYANDDGLEISLYIDDKTGLLSRFETLGSDPFAGDVVNATTFTGYRTEGSRVVPVGRIDTRSGEPLGEIRFTEVLFNKALTDADFKPSGDLKMAAPAPQPHHPLPRSQKMSGQ